MQQFIKLACIVPQFQNAPKITKYKITKRGKKKLHDGKPKDFIGGLNVLKVSSLENQNTLTPTASFDFKVGTGS